MTHHVLKTDPAMFRAVRDGKKNFEVRKDDRAFQAGDTIQLNFHDPDRSGFPVAPPVAFDPDDVRDPIFARIKFVLRGGQYGIEPGFVVLALDDASQEARKSQ